MRLCRPAIAEFPPRFSPPPFLDAPNAYVPNPTPQIAGQEISYETEASPGLLRSALARISARSLGATNFRRFRTSAESANRRYFNPRKHP